MLKPEPDLAKLPIMIVPLTALKLTQDRSIVSFISLKEGSNEFLSRTQKALCLIELLA
ncbi:MAG: hypothetical protein ACKESB_01205 [Candidatus Hodgkinia cicadicola]